MKNLIAVILCAGLFLVSCTKPGCDPAQMTTHINAQRNGLAWGAPSIQGSLSVLDSLTLSATSISNDTKSDSLAFKLFYTGIGSYKLRNSQVFYGTFSTSGLTTYKIDTASNNSLNITGYLDNPSMMNPNQVKITGTFNIKFIDPGDSAGISFLNGSFSVIVNK